MKLGLILEGGGMRGVYTAGVLDCFLDHQIEVDHCYGVSAGICHATSYLASQRGRNLAVNTDYVKDPRYLSVRNLITTGSIFGEKMLYSEIPLVLNPLDYATLNASKTRLTAVVSELVSGEAKYIDITDLPAQNKVVQASCALPLLSNITMIDNVDYMDGGISDSIPIDESFKQGNDKNIVVLTRPSGYQKRKMSMLFLIKLVYRKYPLFIQACANRHLRYNETITHLEQYQEAGKVLLIRPTKPVKVGRLEKDPVKLKALYEMGYQDTLNCISEIKAFIKKKV